MITDIATHRTRRSTGGRGDKRTGRVSYHLMVLFQSSYHFIRFPLGPGEVVVLPLFLVSQTPPPSLFERHSHKNRVIASSNIALISSEGKSGSADLESISFVHFLQKFSELVFSIFKQLVFVA